MSLPRIWVVRVMLAWESVIAMIGKHILYPDRSLVSIAGRRLLDATMDDASPRMT